MMSVGQEFRFLVTQSCNYSCVFCHGEGLQSKKEALLTSDDYRFLFTVGKEVFKRDTTTLTGGEPLLRRDILRVVQTLRDQGALITLLTNGSLLHKNRDIGKFIERLNISVHTTNKDVYEAIVRKKNSFHRMVKGLFAFRDANPQVKIRLNATVVKGTNSQEQDIFSLLTFAEGLRASIKFVELFPPTHSEFVPVAQIEKAIVGAGFSKVPSETRKMLYTNGVTDASITKIFCAAALDFEDPAGFCLKSNDLFVSPDGKIKPCRFDEREVDVKKEVRARDMEGAVQKVLTTGQIIQDCSRHLKTIRDSSMPAGPR